MALEPLDSASANGFIVTIDGIQIPKVNEVSGLKSEVDKIELKQQTSDGKYVIRLRGGACMQHRPRDLEREEGIAVGRPVDANERRARLVTCSCLGTSL